ncbi:uncharacterized protein LOC118408779 [Branchiostoma floridae]|uniref:Uncharacterized protein LOC118408779 n=1 Tax=Branchiostoma floridae TaxID=7739 RepID=A0A9J7HVS4_BRAFL|nr:uncharacterized protein LOC118408779 [Branchiostoma floridae]
MSSKWVPSLGTTTPKQSPGTVKTYSRKVPVARVEDSEESTVFPQPCRSNPFSDEEEQLKPQDKKKQLVTELQSHNCHPKCSEESLQTPAKNRHWVEERSTSQDSDRKSVCGPLPLIKGKKITQVSWRLAALLGKKKKWPSFFQKTRTGTPVATGKHKQWIRKPSESAGHRNEEDPENMSLGDDSVFEREEKQCPDSDSSEDPETSSEESDYSKSESESESQSDTEVLRDTDTITDGLQQFKMKSQWSPEFPGQQKLEDVTKGAPTSVQGQKLSLYHRSLPKEVYVSNKFHLLENQQTDSGKLGHQLHNQNRKIRHKSTAETSRPFTSYEDAEIEEEEASSQSFSDSEGSSLRSILKTSSKTSKKADYSTKEAHDDGERKQVSFSPEVQVSQIDKNTTHPRQRASLVIKPCTIPADVGPSLTCQKMLLQKTKRKAGVSKPTGTAPTEHTNPREDGEMEGRQSHSEGRATQSFNSILLVGQHPSMNHDPGSSSNSDEDSSNDEEKDSEIMREAASTQVDSQPVATGVPVIKRHTDYLQLNSTLVDNALACSILKLDPPGVSPIADAAHTTKAVVPTLLDDVTPLSVQTQPRTDGSSQKRSVEKRRFLKPTKSGEKNQRKTTQEQFESTGKSLDIITVPMLYFICEVKEVKKRKSDASLPSQSGLRSILSGSSQGSGSKRVRFSAELSASTNSGRNSIASLVVKSVRLSSKKQLSMSNSRKKDPATPHPSTGRFRQRVSTAKSGRNIRNVTLQASKDLSSIHIPTYDESDLLINNSLPGVTVNSREIAPDSLSFEQQNKVSEVSKSQSGSVKKGRYKTRKPATKAHSARKTATLRAKASAKVFT